MVEWGVGHPGVYAVNSALGWISAIAEWFGQFIPRWIIVPTTHGAVKFVRGHTVVKLGAGWHMYWPLMTQVTVYPVARQANDLRAQTIVTRDDKTAVVAGLIVFEVSDLEALVAQTFDPDDTIRDVALSAIHDVCIQYDWQGLHAAAQSGALDRDLLKETRRNLERYGVKVLKMALTDLAPCRVFRLVQTSVQSAGAA